MKIGDDHHRREGEDDLDAPGGEERLEPPAPAEQQDRHEADDDRGNGQREVDHAAQQPPAGERSRVSTMATTSPKTAVMATVMTVMTAVSM